MPKPNYPSAGQGVLAGLEAPDDLRHPMWSKPNPNEEMPNHTRALLAEIATRLIPFDGVERVAVTAFCQHVHLLAALESGQTDILWLIAQIVVARYHAEEKLQAMAIHGATRASSDKQTIHRLADLFIEALVKEYA